MFTMSKGVDTISSEVDFPFICAHLQIKLFKYSFLVGYMTMVFIDYRFGSCWLLCKFWDHWYPKTNGGYGMFCGAG